MGKVLTSVFVMALMVSTLSGLPVDDKKQGQHPGQTQSSNHNADNNQHSSLGESHQQQPQGSLHAPTSTSQPGRKTRDTESQKDTSHPSLLGSQSSTTTENSDISSTSTESRRVREAGDSYSHQGGSSVSDNTHPQSGSPYDKGQSLGNIGYQGSRQSSQSDSAHGSVHPLGSSGSSYSHSGTGVSSSTERSSNPYASRSY